MRNKKRRPFYTTPKAIIDHWKWLLLPYYPEDKFDKEFCFICGCEKSDYDVIHRHHILMDYDGGKDEPDNLILVCQDCHPIAPTRDINGSMEDIHNRLYELIKIAQFLNLINSIRPFTHKVNMNEFHKFLNQKTINYDIPI